MILFTMMLATASAGELTQCCDADGCRDDVTEATCDRVGGTWAWCDDEVCEVQEKGGVETFKLAQLAEMGMWGEYFRANFSEPKGYYPPPDDLADPCMAWSLLYDTDPYECEGSIPVNPSNPNGKGSGVDVCEDPNELQCGWCNASFLLCDSFAASMGPIAGAVHIATVCEPNWSSCIQDECGLDCDY